MKCKRTLPTIEEKKLVYPQYFARFLYRLALFGAVLICYVRSPGMLDLTRPWDDLSLPSPALLLCLSMTVLMAAQHFHRPGMSMGRMKQYARYCDISPDYDPAQLRQTVRRQNRGALKVLILWLVGNGVVALLYFRAVIGVAELVVLSAFYYLSDMICILFFCPFQLFLMGNQCCVNCRIFAWGAWMMVTPLVLIRSISVLAPVILAFTLLLRWEIQYHRHPERFWNGSNRALRCARCTEHLCRAKLLTPQRLRSKKP